jgi:thioredoxin 1
MKTGTRLLIAAVVLAAVAGVAVVKARQNTPEDVPESPSPFGGDPAAEPVPSATPGIPRLVDLGSVTCIPCKMMAPILDDLRKEYAGRLQVNFVDVNRQTAATAQFGISVIPTQIFFDGDGNELFRHEGFFSKEDILAKWQELGVKFPDKPAGGG